MTNLSISDTDREQFINFMMQKDFKCQVKYDAVIYVLKTDWLRPFHTSFYVGYSTDLKQRIEGNGYYMGHKESYREEWKDATPDDCYQILQEISIGEYGSKESYGRVCNIAKQGIITACKHQDGRVQYPTVDTILQKDYPDEQELTTLEYMAMELGKIKTRFTNEVLEREMRWIFKIFQEGANLTNIQRIYRHMISALRYRPHIDVLHTPFSSSAWDPIIERYLEDQRLLDARS